MQLPRAQKQQGFVSMIAGTLPVAEFYSEANIARILAGADHSLV